MMSVMSTPFSSYTGSLTRHEVIQGVGSAVAIVMPLLFASSGWWAVPSFLLWVVLAEAFGLTRDCSSNPVQGWLRQHGFTGVADSLNVSPAAREELWLLVIAIVSVCVLFLFSAYAIALIAFWVICVPVALVTAGVMLLHR